MADKRAGGCIYQWTLGYNATVYQAAAKFGQQDVLRLLIERSPANAKLIAACWLHDGAGVSRWSLNIPALPAAFPLTTVARLPRPRRTTTRRQLR